MFTSTCGVDFETRSAVDIGKHGGHRYCTDPTTQAICGSYIRDDVVKSWWPEWVTRILDEEPDDPPYVGRKPGEIYTAWNSAFDRKIWAYVCANDYDWPDTDVEDWLCTMVLARVNGLPAALENAARALGIVEQKDKRGKELIQLLSIPIGGSLEDPIFNEDPKLIREMISYCDQDVRVENGMIKCMREMSATELEEFWASECINDWGIPLDIPFAKKAVRYAAAERSVLEKQISVVTNGIVTKPSQHQRIKAYLMAGYELYLNEDGRPRYEFTGRITRNATKSNPETVVGHIDYPRISPEIVTLMSTYKKGEHKLSCDAGIRTNILQLVEPDEIGQEDDALFDGNTVLQPDTEQAEFLLTDEALEVIKIYDSASKSSIAKFQRMVDQEVEGVVYGAYSFSGAQSTGRYSAKGVQPHNMGRLCVKDFDAAEKSLEGQSDVEVIQTLSKMVRPTLCSDRKDMKLYWADLSSIEARVLPWLCDTPKAHEKVNLFITQDASDDKYHEVYNVTARNMGAEHMVLPEKVTPRDIGKIGELACGFGGAQGSYLAMARGYGIKLDVALAKRAVNMWRDANPWAKPFWARVKETAWNAMENEGVKYRVGRLAYFHTKYTHNGKGTLWCELPSGRLLAYVNPKFELVECPWDNSQKMWELTAIKANFKPKADETEWPRYKLWYGVLCLAKDTEVLTHLGWVKIQHVNAHHLIWDGDEWVTNDGLSVNGKKDTIKTHGIYTTPDHLILTEEGWYEAEISRRFNKQKVRLPYGFEKGGRNKNPQSVGSKVCMWVRKRVQGIYLGEWCCKKLRLQAVRNDCVKKYSAWEVLHTYIRGVGGYETAVFKSEVPEVPSIWCERYKDMRRLDGFRKILSRYVGYVQTWFVDRPKGQQWALRENKLSLGGQKNLTTKPRGFDLGGHPKRADEPGRSGGSFWGEIRHYILKVCARRKTVLTYDVVNCGPRRRYVVRGDRGPVIVHNCENATQASANDCLRHSIVNGVNESTDERFIRFHTHDEMGAQSRFNAGPWLVKLLTTNASWAEGLPLAADYKEGFRYGK